VAEKQMGGQPYRYSYAINRGQKNPPQVEQKGAPKPVTKERPAGAYEPSHIPLYTGAPGNAMSGEAAIVLGSLALLLILADLADDGDDAAAGKPGGAGAVLNVSGTAEPIAPAVLDRGELVEVIVPNAPPQIGRLKAGVARGLAEAVGAGFESLGARVVINDAPRSAGRYVVRSTVLRAQGNLVQYTNLTVEVSLHDQRTGRELTRMLVQAAEKPFDLKAQTERQNAGGIATSIFVKPLQAKLRTYVR
jgi:hypothetical protein